MFPYQEKNASDGARRWAFADFFTAEHATAALTNPKNHFLDGRKLVVEYASPEAVRRGGGLPREKGKGSPRDRSDRFNGGGERRGRGDAAEEGEQKRRGERVRPKRKSEAVGEDEPDEQPAKRQRLGREEPPHKGREGRDSRPKVRAKPGAALANAKRETVGIVPSQGKKIVF